MHEQLPNVETKKEKTYLYHMVPSDMQGSVLHPLNTLKSTHPELYLAKALKYADRRHVMEQFIPALECAWNDALHLTAVNPLELKKAIIEAGMHPTEMKFYEINPDSLDPKNTTVYLYQDKTSNDKMNRENFQDYDPKNLKVHGIISQVTKDYYKRMHEGGKSPLLFVGVPHILHIGSIDVSTLKVITV